MDENSYTSLCNFADTDAWDQAQVGLGLVTLLLQKYVISTTNVRKFEIQV